jgi:hypothetical protein
MDGEPDLGGQALADSDREHAVKAVEPGTGCVKPHRGAKIILMRCNSIATGQPLQNFRRSASQAFRTHFDPALFEFQDVARGNLEVPVRPIVCQSAPPGRTEPA